MPWDLQNGDTIDIAVGTHNWYHFQDQIIVASHNVDGGHDEHDSHDDGHH
eukprot:CAMPEP_0114667666 /NCGR_PEP_ID=MMETSP0191-20121206/34948_1 /TAXON_ID=126664 /ORGANISM="Sorites sp." /LENGTH=49 /DNA_ID=CAMNT_0001918861 /DNA_START=473 /DNA_END=622 /DNA_ORIENTATION=+